MPTHNLSAVQTLKDALTDQLSLSLANTLKVNHAPTIGVACSGGRDSMLLTALCMQVLEASFPKCRLLILTVDHGLHPNSRTFAEAVVSYWQNCGLDADHLHADPDLIKQGSGIEDGARKARYAALEQAKAEHDVEFILFGHHAGDQAESVLMRLQSSSGLQGLSGIPKQRDWILRPWLEVSPLVIEEVFHQLKLPLYEDPSNQDLRFLRNAIRHQISPHCAQVFGSSWQNRIAQSAKHLSEDAEVYNYFLDSFTEGLLHNYAHIGRFKLQWSHLDSSIPQALEKAVIRQFYTTALRSFSQQNDLRRVKEQIQYLWQLWTSNKTQALSLPHGLKAWGRRRELWIYYEAHFPLLPADYQISIDPRLFINKQKFSLQWGEWCLEFKSINRLDNVATRAKDELCSLVTIPENLRLHLRLPKKGERFSPVTAPGSKRVTRLWSDRKVPIFERSRLAVLSDQENQILWVPYCRPHQKLIDQLNPQVWQMTWRLDKHLAN